jgi:hypothetical protein
MRSASASVASVQLVVGHHARDQAVAVGLVGVQHARGQAHVHRLGLADGTRQALRAAGAGQHGQLDLGQRELGAVRGDDDVAGQRQLAAAADGEARHRGKHRLAHASGSPPSCG